MATPTPNDLTKEKSLFALWKLSFKFGQSRFNLIIALLVAALIFRFVYLIPDRPELIASQLRRLLSPP